MATRAPAAGKRVSAPDEAHLQVGACKPFYLQIRHLTQGDVKLIWWYIATVDETQQPVERSEDDERTFKVEFHGYDMAVEKVTFASDRETMKQAVTIVKDTLSAKEALRYVWGWSLEWLWFAQYHQMTARSIKQHTS